MLPARTTALDVHHMAVLSSLNQRTAKIVWALALAVPDTLCVNGDVTWGFKDKQCCSEKKTYSMCLGEELVEVKARFCTLTTDTQQKKNGLRLRIWTWRLYFVYPLMCTLNLTYLLSCANPFLVKLQKHAKSGAVVKFCKPAVVFDWRSCLTILLAVRFGHLEFGIVPFTQTVTWQKSAVDLLWWTNVFFARKGQNEAIETPISR